ncbi:INO80 complex subunit E [Nymphon striatum]|nr:INO80 complex subunit E [Nymphon striatum]
MPVSEDIIFGSGVYLQKYKILKRKLKLLIYENECFQDNLRNCQRKLLKVERDKAFLLDRLLQYEHADDSSSDSDATLSSESDIEVNHSAQPSTPARKYDEWCEELEAMHFRGEELQQKMPTYRSVLVGSVAQLKEQSLVVWY